MHEYDEVAEALAERADELDEEGHPLVAAHFREAADYVVDLAGEADLGEDDEPEEDELDEHDDSVA